MNYYNLAMVANRRISSILYMEDIKEMDTSIGDVKIDDIMYLQGKYDTDGCGGLDLVDILILKATIINLVENENRKRKIKQIYSILNRVEGINGENYIEDGYFTIRTAINKLKNTGTTEFFVSEL